MALNFGIDREGPEQEGRPAKSGLDVPETDGAADMTVILGRERESLGRKPAFAQPLGGLQASGSAEAQVEEMLTGENIARTFMADLKQGHTLSRSLGGGRTILASGRGPSVRDGVFAGPVAGPAGLARNPDQMTNC